MSTIYYDVKKRAQVKSTCGKNSENSFSHKPELGIAINSGLSYYRALNEYKKYNKDNDFEYAKSCKQIFTKYLTEYYETKINENQSLQNEGIEPDE